MCIILPLVDIFLIISPNTHPGTPILNATNGFLYAVCTVKVAFQAHRLLI